MDPLSLVKDALGQAAIGLLPPLDRRADFCKHFGGCHASGGHRVRDVAPFQADCNSPLCIQLGSAACVTVPDSAAIIAIPVILIFPCCLAVALRLEQLTLSIYKELRLIAGHSIESRECEGVLYQ